MIAVGNRRLSMAFPDFYTRIVVLTAHALQCDNPITSVPPKSKEANCIT